jgi:RNA polymerase sigma factor (sigma-70 family)
MATSHMSGVIQHLRRAVLLRDGAGLTDGQLLEDYISRRDEAAFAVLVRRHAPMVWGVCRRVLRNDHDAEDAFQATFLVLVRKAASITSRELLANWLYGVAHQTGLKARAIAAKRKGRESQVKEMPEPKVTQQEVWHDLQPLLDEELSRLPDKYRVPIVLCDLEGKTRKEAAQLLGCPEGTVAGRLARARVMLAKRLAQRGVTLSGGALAVVLSEKVASAGVPTSVVSSTIKAASLFAAGQTAGVISAKVAALTEGVVKAMSVTKIKSVLTVVLVVGLALGGIGAGFGLFTNSVAVARTEPPKQPPAKEESPAAPVATKKDEKPPHIVEKTDMKGRMESPWLPHKVQDGKPTEDGLLIGSKSFFAKMQTYPDIRFREFFDPRYLKKHGLTERDIAFEVIDKWPSYQGIHNIVVADDNQTALCILDTKGGKELFILRWVVYEGHLYISPEKAPDPKTGIFKPWILRAKVK